MTSQVTNLISMFIHTANFLIASRNDESREGGPLDGGAVTAVETTVISICDRMDAMLKDPSLWSLGFHKKLEQSVKNLYDAQTEALKAQRDAYAEISSPHSRYKPKLVKMKNGSWLAFLGNPEDLDNALCGVGDYPAAALEAFDSLFAGQVDQNLQHWLNEHETEIKKSEHEHKNPVDPGTNRNPEKSPSAGGDGPEHSEGDGLVGEIG